ncbi:MAG TPA: MBL fold metallo-hydrolase [Vicinamibacterales bacterium]|nr:MBL fold metallo-hydrolase [Vicinamibacterales bacterium]
MRVLFLGTGTSHGVPAIGCDCAVCSSADPRDRRLRPSIYLECDDDTRVLVDTSPDLRTQALTHGIRRVDAICLTHAHADHIMGLDDVRRFNAMSGKTMPIYSRAETLDDIRRIFHYAFEVGKPAAGGVPDLQLVPIDGPFAIGGQTVVPVPIAHGRWSILGFRVGRFAYLTDCSAVPESSFALLDGLDTLVIDALRHEPHPTHFTVAEAIETARRIGAAQTYLTHIAHDLGHAVTSAALPPGVMLAYDGLRLDVPAA